MPSAVAAVGDLAETGSAGLGLDRHLVGERELPRGVDLRGGERGRCLDQPAVQAGLQVVLAHRVLGDHRVRRGGAAGQAADRLNRGAGQAVVAQRAGRFARLVSGDAGAAALAIATPGHLHVRQARQPWPHGEDVGAGSDLAGLDPVRGEQLRGGHVHGAGEIAFWRRRARLVQRGAADSSGSTDRACRLAARLLTCPLRLATWALLSCVIMPAVLALLRVDDQLAAGQVGAGPVERIVELDAGDDADGHGQEHGERGRRQRGAGPGPVADQVAQRDPDRDRQPRSRPGCQHADAQRGEQDDPGDHGDQAGQQEQRAALLRACLQLGRR